MKRFLLMCMLGMVASVASVASATTYHFAGANYTTPQAPFTTAMRVSGSFTTAQPLPANMPLTVIGPQGSNLVTSWQFSDGITQYTMQDSVVFSLAPNLSFKVATDGSGQISQYTIALLSPLPPHTVGQPVNAFLITNTPNVATLANYLLPCEAINASNVCQVTINDQVVEMIGGTWAAYETHQPVPALDRWGVLLTAMLLLGFAAWMRRTAAP